MEEFNNPYKDPKNYKWGIFYCNRSDSSIFVPKRFGFGYTLNFGLPYVTIATIVILLTILYF